MVELNLKHIYKHYDNAEDDQYSVTDFNLDIKDREFIVFVGPSGCGKSTTLRMIAGLEDISKGEFLIDGRVVNDEAPKDRDIAMVFQNYALYPHMTVYDNMAFGLKLRKYDKGDIDKRVHHAAKILGLEEYLQRKPAALSGGQRQRVALGRAIVRDAPIFLMDEPLSNLDAKLRVSMRAEIAKLHQQLKTTTIYVTHDQTEAMTMADRIVVMRDGKIQQVGTPQEVYDHPANVFVGGFIGSPAMNFFKVTLKDGKITDDGNNFTMTEKKSSSAFVRKTFIQNLPSSKRSLSLSSTLKSSFQNFLALTRSFTAASAIRNLFQKLTRATTLRQDRRFKWALTSTRRTSSTKTRNCPYIKIRPLVFQRGFGMLRSLFLCIL